MCFVIGTEDVGSHDWGVDGEIDDIFFQNTTYMQTVLKDYWGRENQNAYLEYDTSTYTRRQSMMLPYVTNGFETVDRIFYIRLARG